MQQTGGTPGKGEIKRIAVVGTGVIGASWVAYFLARGLDVSATDPMPEAGQKLRAAVARHWPSLETLGLAPGASMSRLRFFEKLEDALQGADFVQENGPEREDLKTDLFRRMDAALPAQVILASSSSGLLMSKVQAACRHPERVVLGHPFNPPHLIPLVEVIGGQLTSPEAVQGAIDFYAAIGKKPIHVRKEVKGHIANRLQAALWREAFHLVEQGVASTEDIDTAIAYGPGLRWALMGPYLNLHMSGGEGGIKHMLDHLGPPIESWWADLGTPAITDALKETLRAGVEQQMQGMTSAEVAAERDRLLVKLLASKAESKILP
ncbi:MULTISPECIES: 3-hydroxyacyl-CoA dehydrogenase NAD-binding domain-containing protein [unclassified Herbaspirillum]|uniref:3-hydroxyacyl-CoA dehydrogenase NAD-binding domain-containing protein n=1 Tax=unclassified Herbaspirillum TaxID=2624150 RepID=UPI00114D89C4|nr:MULTISPECIES: 3-hydroxyacyl-CoA dehydrogenase NAD-binding domain-containing protein [unclassified Herbaspirillum]MBB5390032.1 3-hydroxyacyl-CoA dehydrogenase [Herbaspirillum sp. SJZ102]TQK09466.1 3-hydroxyacyl-CoA dehydrogenase [Herbaspirillum sp. SJZ130]TQK13847.1 3-hydroxyacyl-CoA dehydrogenase [Herbaspirillum sp. SJZ106]